jgi:hypothetical protein
VQDAEFCCVLSVPSRTGADRPGSLLSIPHAKAWTPCSVQPIPAYSNVFRAFQTERPTYSSLFQGIPAYSSLFPDKKIS